MSKKTLLFIVTPLFFASLFCIFIPVEKVRALNSNFADRLQERASDGAARQNNQLARIISRADTMIQTRLTSLQNLLARVQNDTRLTDGEKSSFASSISTDISQLTSLKTKIDADTDVTTALVDTKSIVTSYRIYLVFDPQMRFLVIIDNLQTASTHIASLVTKIQTLLTSLQGQGKDITATQTALTDISTQLIAINTLLATDKTLLQNVTITTTDPASIFSQVKKDLAAVRADVAKIRSDFATIRSFLKPLQATPTASSSAK